MTNKTRTKRVVNRIPHRRHREPRYTDYLQLRVSPQHKEALERAALDNRRDISVLARMILEDYLIKNSYAEAKDLGVI